MAEPKKDTIYVDIDDEITGIIDKVRGSSGKVTALVLPKRAGVFQSIVNMKLLKRAADEADKNLVLITSEAGLLPLAGAAGIHVAKTINSKPEIPMAPKLEDAATEEAIDETGAVTAVTAATAAAAATAAKASAQPPAENGVETLQLDDEDLPPEDTPKPSAAGKKPKDFTPPGSKAAKPKSKGKGDKKFKIPNFGSFRKKLIFGGIILFLLIFGLIMGIFVLPKATINIKTDASKIPVELDLTLSTTATELDTDNNTLPAKLASQQKTYSQQVPTTGQKNQGNKAGGTVTLVDCSTNDVTIPAGTAFSSNGNTYVSQQTVTVPASSFRHGNCQNDEKATVTIQAQSGGSSYNLPAGSTFSVSNAPSGLSAQGNTISGGTDNIVQTVNQNDINKAKAQIAASNDNAQKKALQKQLEKDGYFAITATFSAGSPNTTQSAPVGAGANNVTVTETISYSMFGVHEKDLDTLVDDSVEDQIDTSKQSILSQGLDQAVFDVNSATATTAQINMQTNAEAGPELDIAAIKREAAGQKPNTIKAQLQNNPDVTSVNVKLSPFWVSSVPKKESKIQVKIAEPTVTKGNNNAGNP